MEVLWKEVPLALGFETLGGLLGTLGEGLATGPLPDASPEQHRPTGCTGFLLVPDAMMKDEQEWKCAPNVVKRQDQPWGVSELPTLSTHQGQIWPCSEQVFRVERKKLHRTLRVIWAVHFLEVLGSFENL